MARPVIVGIAQILQRPDDLLKGKEPLSLMVDALRAAAEDAGSGDLIKQGQSVRVVRGVWRYQNPAAYVAEQLGLAGVETVGTPYGGNSVQSVVNQSALEIQRGEKDIILITGAENGNSQAKARKAGIRLEVTDTPGDYDRVIGSEEPMAGDAEMARDIRRPIQIYPIFENAIRFQLGESITDHIKRVSELWARFSQVAAKNPNAWIRDPVDADTIRTASATNRMISFPYPKLMNSNNAVDMAAALIMCSDEKARQLGIPEDKWVYPWAGTDAHDHYLLSSRENLFSSPAIRIAGKRVFELTGLTSEDTQFMDIYSCFPSAVQVAASELDIDMSRELTVTGGLTFGGGPLNNYVMHSIARTVELLRENRDEKALVTANGGYLTKHAFGIYGAEPPADGFRHANVQQEVDALPKREAVVDHEGEVMIESYTVMFGAEGPEIAHAACLLADGRRTWANTQDQDVMAAMQVEEFCGLRAQVDGAGNLILGQS